MTEFLSSNNVNDIDRHSHSCHCPHSFSTSCLIMYRNERISLSICSRPSSWHYRFQIRVKSMHKFFDGNLMFVLRWKNRVRLQFSGWWTHIDQIDIDVIQINLIANTFTFRMLDGSFMISAHCRSIGDNPRGVISITIGSVTIISTVLAGREKEIMHRYTFQGRAFGDLCLTIFLRFNQVSAMSERPYSYNLDDVPRSIKQRTMRR